MSESMKDQIKRVAVMSGTDKTTIPRSSLLLEKVIYAKRKPFTKEQVTEVLDLEIRTHLSKYAGLEFDKIGDVVKNDDRSFTYPIFFKEKELK